MGVVSGDSVLLPVHGEKMYPAGKYEGLAANSSRPGAAPQPALLSGRDLLPVNGEKAKRRPAPHGPMSISAVVFGAQM